MLQYIQKIFAPIRSMKGPLIRGCLQSMLWAAFDVYAILLFEYVADAIQTGAATSFKPLLIQFVIVLIVYTAIKAVIRHRGWTQMYEPYQAQIAKRYYPLYFGLDYTYTEKFGVGRAINIVKTGIDEWSRLFIDIAYFLPSFLIKLGFSLYYVMKLGRIYGLGFLCAILCLNIIVIKLNKRAVISRNQRKLAEIEKSRQEVHMLMSKQEVLQNSRIPFEIGRYEQLSYNIQYRAKVVNNYVRGMFNTPTFFVGLVSAGALAYVVAFYGSGDFSFGTYTALVAISGLLSSSLMRTTEAFKNMGKNRTHIQSLRDFLDDGPQMVGYDTGADYVHQDGHIAVDDVSFCYDEGKSVFNNFSLTLQGGAKTALVGASGSGKTTLVKLIAGYLRPDSGSVSIDGQYLPGSELPSASDDHVALQSYYSHIGYLTQEPSIFDGSIWENLTYALADDQYDDLDAAVQQAIVDAKCEFVYEFADGLQTQIGERGIKLSGGQRQRLAIAKIFLKNPSIIILDEPTSALDSFSEEAITQAMHTLFEGRTVIIVAHRLQTVKQADDIILLDQGQIVERGRHDDLVAQGGHYAQMLELQSGF